MKLIGANIVICALLCSMKVMASKIHVNITDDLLTAQTEVDNLISEYWDMEQLLWKRIENRADNVLLQVYKSHETFFDRVIEHSGSGATRRNIIPNIDTLIAIGESINSTTELGQMHLKEQILDKQSITEYANSALKILKNASSLFDYAKKEFLWNNIITVR